MLHRIGVSWRKTFGRSRKLLLGTVILVAVVGSAMLAPVLTRYDPVEADLAHALERPSRGHVFGTDQLGRDLLARILYAGRVTLGISICSLALSAVIGVTLGLAAGYVGGALDAAIMRYVDAQLAFPGILLAIAILGWPVDKLPPQVAGTVVQGARSVCTQNGIPLAGGHSIDIQDPVFGLAVT
ncbi:MAG: hypothetical protein K6T75_11445, partial [Acetobacteraceae bacterium]|nr:hypothetical protein [Acetobacteraceae bacterium]